MKKYGLAILVILLFILSSFFSQQYSGYLVNFIGENKTGGILIYIASIVIAIVLAPLTILPLIPIAVEIWGILWTSIFSIIGLIIGSAIAFWIARKFGTVLVKKFVSLDNIAEISKKIPNRNLFWYLIFLRIIIPVDILSYALGLFTKISWKLFLSTTIIGVIPMIFVFAYFGTIPMKYQLLALITGIILLILYKLINKKFRSNQNK
jgi:uncharacterized membrane protein YdjX (TVP38/TMEM64 family)